jgi:hypothetical protein
MSGSLTHRSPSCNLTNVSLPRRKVSSHVNQDAILTVISVTPVCTYLIRAGYLDVNVYLRCQVCFQAELTFLRKILPKFKMAQEV